MTDTRIVFYKQKTAYGMGISDWSSDVCSSDLLASFHIDDLETPALACEALALLRQMLQDRQRVARGGRIVAVVVEFDPQPLGHLVGGHRPGDQQAAVVAFGHKGDRKSTRLNSSH